MTYQPNTAQPPAQPFYGPEAQNIKVQEYLHTAQAGALVPLIQSGITGLLVALIVLVVLTWQDVQDWYVYVMLTWLIVWLLAWWQLQRHWFSLTTVERLTGLDINQDGYVGEVVETPAHVVRVDLRTVDQAGQYHADRGIELPVTESQLADLAPLFLAGRMGERDLAGHGVGVNTIRSLKGALRKRGIIAYVNPNAPTQGDKLTPAGRAVMRHFAGLSLLPLPSPSDESE